MRSRILTLFILLIAAAGVSAQSATVEFIKGNSFFDQKKYQEAAAAYTECIRLDPRHTGCYQNRGLARQIAIGFGLALDDFNKLVELQPDAKSYRLRGSLYNSLKRYNEAIADFNSSIRVNAREAMAFHGRAYSYEQLGDPQKAITDYSQAISFNPSYAPSYMSRGHLFKDAKRYDEAVADYTKAIGLKPSDDYAYLCRGEVYFKQGKTDLAEPDFQKAISLDPSNETMVRAWKTLARSKAILDRTAPSTSPSPSPATPKPVATIPASTKTADQHLASGRSFATAGNHLEAVNEFTAARRLAPNNGLISFYRGVSQTRLGRTEDAIIDYGEAIRLGSALKEATFNRGTLYYNRGEYRLALADLDRSIQLDAMRWSVFYNRGLAHYQLGDMDKALGDFNKSIELNPKEGNPLVMRSRIYCKQMLKVAAKKDEDAAIALGANVGTRCG